MAEEEKVSEQEDWPGQELNRELLAAEERAEGLAEKGKSLAEALRKLREYARAIHRYARPDDLLDEADAALSAWDASRPKVEGRVYAASRTKHAPMWRGLRAFGAPIISTWIDEAGPGETADLSELWQRVESEVRGATRVVLYAEADDFPLKGALIECGIALAAGVPIELVLPGVDLEPRSMRPIGSWAAHPGVRIVNDLARAVLLPGDASKGKAGEP